MHPLLAEPGMPVEVTWRIPEGENTQSELMYKEEGNPEWPVVTTQIPERFEYADVFDRWHNEWPPQPNGRDRIPSMIRLLDSEDHVVWTVKMLLFPRPVVRDQDRS